jgi:hypothetical protein
MNISVCVVAKGNSELVKFAINNAIEKTFLFANYYFNCDYDNFDFCKSIAEKTDGGIIQTKDNISKCYNELLLNDADYYVILPINTIVNEFWLEDLVITYEKVEKSGVLSIPTGFEKLKTTTILHKTTQGSEDVLKVVYKEENNFIDGILFFSKSILDKVGKFDPNCQQAFFKNDFSWRVGMMGYQNFYIKNQQIIELPLPDEAINPTKTIDGNKAFKLEIKQMFKTQQFIK